MPPAPTPSATTAQLVRAHAIGEALKQRGWNARPEPAQSHPGAVGASRCTVVRPTGEISLLTLSLGELGQMAELTGDPASAARPAGGRRRSGAPAWRLTAYDPPAHAVVTAAFAAAGSIEIPWRLNEAGWDVEHTRDPAGHLRITGFTRPDGTVRTEFHAPTLTPRCKTCEHPGSARDGGWLVTGPGFTAEASVHTPEPVITAFALALPGFIPAVPMPTTESAP